MRQEGHLQVFDLILKTKGPVFIGCGRSYTKKEYIFDLEPNSNRVSFVDELKFFTYLAEHGLADAYERYILDSKHGNLGDFLKEDCKLSTAQIRSMIRCEMDAGNALDGGHALKEIRRFIRDGNDRVYVPGSSIKGALRTVLLKAMLLENPPKNPDPERLYRKFDNFEQDYFHTLSLKKDHNQIVQVGNPLNSIMQGVRISDSLPVPDSRLCLTPKIDVYADGTYNQINICRESIKPGTAIQCTITLDQSILKGKLTRERILQAVEQVSKYYQDTVLSHYPHVDNYMNSRTMLLGGGAGFQSKTVTDPYYGADALNITAEILHRAFRNHYHDRDAAGGISPRALNQTDYNQAPYPYGVCEVFIQ